MTSRSALIVFLLFFIGGIARPCFALDADRLAHVLVKFKADTSTPEAHWIMWSYPIAFELVPRKVTDLTIENSDATTLTHAVTALRRNIENNRELSGANLFYQAGDGKVEVDIYGDTSTYVDVQHALSLALPKNISLHWSVSASYAVADVDSTRADQLITLLRSESQVANVYQTDVPDSTSIEASARIENYDSGFHNSIGPIRQPRTSSTKATNLPTSAIVIRTLHEFYRQKDVDIKIEKEDHDGSGEYFEVLVSKVKGVVTEGSYWERLRYSIPIYLSGTHVLKIRCILDGEFAPGFGANEPRSEMYKSLEPQYTVQLSSQLNRFIFALTGHIKEVHP